MTLAPGQDNITITAGASIANSGSILKFQSGGSFVNNGTLTLPATSGSTLVPVKLSTGTQAIRIVNNGTIATTSSSSASDSSIGLEVTATGAAPITVTNSSSGALGINGNDGDSGMLISAAGGPVRVENDGSISGSGYFGTSNSIQVTNNGADISITNSGPISIGARTCSAIATSISHAGQTTVTNSAPIEAYSYSSSAYSNGLELSGGSGDIIITNSGSITASAYVARGIFATTGGAVTLTTSSAIANTTGFFEGLGSGGLGEGEDVTAGGNVSINSGSAITFSSSGYYASTYGIEAQSSSGSVSVASTQPVKCTNSAYYYGNCYGILAQTSGGKINVNNSSSVSCQSTVGNSVGVVVVAGGSSLGALGTITNSGAISVGGGQQVAAGIEFNGAGLTAHVTNSAGGSVTVSGEYYTSNCGMLVANTTGNDIITNAGTITCNGLGIQDVGPGNITVNLSGGSINPQGSAVMLGSGSNTVNVSGSPIVKGLIDGGSAATGTLRFTVAQASQQQRTQFAQVAAEAAADPAGTYGVALGAQTYKFTDFKTVTVRYTRN